MLNDRGLNALKEAAEAEKYLCLPLLLKTTLKQQTETPMCSPTAAVAPGWVVESTLGQNCHTCQ